MADEKLNKTYYKGVHLWMGSKAIRQLNKINSKSKKDLKSWLSKQALWQVHIPSPKNKNNLHYEQVLMLYQDKRLLVLLEQDIK